MMNLNSLLNLNDPKIELVNTKYGKDAASLWKISNALMRLSLILLAIGIISLILLLIIPYSLSFLNVDNSPFSCGGSSENMILCSFLPIILMFLILIGGMFLGLYSLSVLVLSILMKDYVWAAGIFFIGLPTLIYKPTRKF